MVHSGIYATSSEITVKAGTYNSTVMTEAVINALCLQAEGYICARTKVNWTDLWASLNADVKSILGLAESNLVAMYLINNDMSVYPQRIYAETMLDVLRDGFVKAMEVLENKPVSDWIRAGAIN